MLLDDQIARPNGITLSLDEKTLYDRRALVLALNERTYMTLVCPLAPRAKFRAQFATALKWALHDLHVPAPAIDRESG